jgi:DNA-directed RNA polymerase specialized sigma24 family protein
MDAESVRRCTRLHALYGRRVRSYIAAYLGRTDYHLADDLAQDTWVRVMSSLHTLRAPDEAAFDWLAATARSAVIAHRRARRETPVDFTGRSSRLLPVTAAAEDVALVRMTARMVAADSPLGVVA